MLKCPVNCFAQVSRLKSEILFIIKKDIENMGNNTTNAIDLFMYPSWSAGLHTKGAWRRKRASGRREFLKERKAVVIIYSSHKNALITPACIEDSLNRIENQPRRKRKQRPYHRFHYMFNKIEKQNLERTLYRLWKTYQEQSADNMHASAYVCLSSA